MTGTGTGTSITVRLNESIIPGINFGKISSSRSENVSCRDNQDPRMADTATTAR